MFKERLARIRIKRRLHQNTLAELTGLSKKALSLLENGERLPTFNSIVKLCNALHISADYFLCLGDDEDKEEFSYLYSLYSKLDLDNKKKIKNLLIRKANE